jgi:hypothetical protein
MDQEKNELVISGKYDMETSLFSNDKRRKEFTSLNINNEEEANLLLASDGEADFKLNDEIGKEITVIGVKATEREEETTNEETGEVIVRLKHTLMLFDEEGKTHVTGSNACYKSFERIVSIKRYLPTKERPMTVRVIQSPANEKGHNYLRLQFVR